MRRAIVFALAVITFAYLSGSATIIDIPDDFPTIQEGIDASIDGDTVLVQPNTYVENINFNGHNVVLGSLFLTTGDTSYISQTIIDGNESGSVLTFNSGEDRSAIITGFTIQNGLGSGCVGGGIHCQTAGPVIRHNVIRWNDSGGCGEGGHGPGGGIRCSFDSNPLISNNIIKENQAGDGAGIHCENSNPTIVGNLVTLNESMGNSWGGGGNGGGIGSFESNAIITNNIIAKNSALGEWRSGWGGGIDCYGGGIIIIINNTISENYAIRNGGGISVGDATTVIVNSIIWGNTGYPQLSGNPTVSYCDVEGGWEGEGNIDVDPLFRDPESDDLHLMSAECGHPGNSPCIDAGDPAIIDSLLDCSWGLGTILSDMGAYGGGDSVQVGIDNRDQPLPDKFRLSQNYPNPFNASTTIWYNLPEASNVIIEIYDLLGRRVGTLVQGEKPAGYHQAVWDAGDHSSGLYFYRIQAGEYAESRKMVLLK